MVRKVKVFIVMLAVFFFSAGYLFAQTEALRKVETLVLKDDYAQAAQECKKILVHHHQAALSSKAHYLLGISQLKLGQYPQARENFEVILRKFSQSEFRDDASLGIADSYFLAGDFQKAQERYEQFLKDSSHSKLTSIARKHLEQCQQGRHFANSYFSVQVGCFSKKQNAEELRDRLINAGFQAYLLELPGENLYRVRVGKFSDRLNAEFLEQRLKSEGFPTKICP